MKKKKQRRWRLWADSKVQGELCLRVFIYWTMCQFSIFTTFALFGFISDAGNGGAMKLIVPTMIVSTLILPIALFDMLKCSNKFVGPIVNVRQRLRQIVDTRQPHEFKIRSGDHYADLCHLLNELQAELGHSDISDAETLAEISKEKLEECHV